MFCAVKEKEKEDEEDEDEFLLHGVGTASRSQHYTRLQYIQNCWYFGLRNARMIALLLKQKTISRLSKLNGKDFTDSFSLIFMFMSFFVKNSL